jgi:hypothetical protein
MGHLNRQFTHGVRMASERRTDVAKLDRLTVTVDVRLRLIAKRS